MNAYHARDAILAHMGYESYSAYLASEAWKKIRLRVLKKDGFRCRTCGGRATQVHHSRYDRKILCGQSLRGLWSSCPDCHRKGEFSESGQKRTQFACNDAMGIPLAKGQKRWRKKRGLAQSWVLH